MADFNKLAVIDGNKMSVFSEAEKIRGIMEDLKDVPNLGQKIMGRAKIGSGGMRAFNIQEAGSTEADVVKEITGVIVLSHACNVYWSRPMEEAGDDKKPDCASGNGELGTWTETGEVMCCATCPKNQFGSDAKNGKGKACRNMRRLYILRETDLFPVVLTLPPTSLGPFDNYRIAVSVKGMRMHGIVTRITLNTKKNGSNTDYSVPAFEAVGTISPDDAARIKAYAEEIQAAAERSGIAADDYTEGFQEARDTGVAEWDEPAPPPPEAEQQGFLGVDADELPPDAV